MKHALPHLPTSPSGLRSSGLEPHERHDRPLLELRNLAIAFRRGQQWVDALHRVDLSIHKGETVGMVGESGSGKSITWLAVLGLLGRNARVSGSVSLEGTPIEHLSGDQLNAVRGRRIAMIFQDPAASLNPVRTVGAQLCESLRLHHDLDALSAQSQAVRLLDQVHIPGAARHLRSYPHELSGGMNQRVMIAMALSGQPDLLVADEPTTALDATIQAQVLDLLSEIQRDTRMALVLISHDLGVIAELCERVSVLYAGRIVESGPTQALFEHPRHPYTEGLLAAAPELDMPPGRLVAIPGSVPEPGQVSAGCAFSPRCARAQPDCLSFLPDLRSLPDQRLVSCIHPVLA